MGWFSKDKKEGIDSGIPELPELPETSNFPSSSNSKLPDLDESPLPEIPAPATNSHQQVIKQALEPLKQEPFQKSRFIQESSSIKNPIEDSSLSRIESKIPQPRAIEVKPVPKPISQAPVLKKNEPVYIRLDKFQTTVETFREVSKKIQEIEELLKKTKEIKIKEEEELSEWEKEIQIIKQRIDTLDLEIFSKLD